MPEESSEATRAPVDSRNRWILQFIAIAAAAGAIRWLYLLQYANRLPFLKQPVLDAAYYDAWARRIITGNLFPAEAFFHAPGYPWFVAAVYKLLGPEPWHAIVVQSVLGVLTTVAVAGIAGILFDREEALLSGILMLGTGMLYFHESKLIVESWALCLLTFSLLAMIAAERRLPVAATPAERASLERAASEGRRPPAPGRGAPLLAFMAGIFAGAAAVARAGLILIPVILAIVMLIRAAGRRRPWSTALLYSAGVVLALAPAAIHNISHGAPAPVSTDGGLGFHRGNVMNSREAPALSGSLALEEAEADSVVVGDIGRTLAPGPESGYWISRAVREITADLPAWVALEGRKAWRFVSRPIDEKNGSMRLEASRVVWLRLLALPFNFFVAAGIAGLVLAAGLFGAARRGARGVLTVPVVTVVLLFATSLALSVTPGLKLMALPILAVFAAHALARADLAWRSGGRRTVLVVTAAGLAFVALSWPAPAGSRAGDLKRQGLLFLDAGKGLEARGKYEEARTTYLEATKAQPGDYEAWHRLGQLKLRDRDLVGAITYFERARNAAPEQFSVRNNLGILYYTARRYAQADSELAAAIRLKPDQAGPFFYRGLVAKQEGDRAKAEAFLQQSLEIDPRFTGAYVRLIEVLLDQGRLDDARAWANRAGERAVALPPELASRLR